MLVVTSGNKRKGETLWCSTFVSFVQVWAKVFFLVHVLINMCCIVREFEVLV